MLFKCTFKFKRQLDTFWKKKLVNYVSEIHINFIRVFFCTFFPQVLTMRLIDSKGKSERYIIPVFNIKLG